MGGSHISHPARCRKHAGRTKTTCLSRQAARYAARYGLMSRVITAQCQEIAAGRHQVARPAPSAGHVATPQMKGAWEPV